MRANPGTSSDKPLVWICPSMTCYLSDHTYHFPPWKIFPCKLSPWPLLMLWEQGLPTLNKSKNSENEHLCPTMNSSAAPMQPLLLKNILLWHPWILLGYFKFESVSSQFGCRCWLAGTSIILWFSVGTRGGKVQFVWRKLKMNSGVQIQCMCQPPVRSIRYSVIKYQRNTAGG